MKIPISWLKDYIDLEGLSIEEIASKLTLAGLEVDEIHYVGLEMPARQTADRHEFKTSGIGWDRDKIVVAEIREVNAHPNADRLTLLDLFDGTQSQVVLTGAPNIFHLKGQGKLSKPLKVGYAKEGAAIYDGHADGLVLTTLKRAKIRGVDSYSMVCSEKELGIAEDHEGIILLEDDAPVGMPLADYMGDAVLDISIAPNMARNANVLGVARELAAITGRKLRQPSIKFKTSGESVAGLVSVKIADAELNPRFVLGLIRNVAIRPSPYQVQRRLKLAGMRPINSIVDATNYAMLDIGEPLHAFDFDVLRQRAKEKSQVKLSTRAARDGEQLTTLDNVDRKLTAMNVLVCDEKGSLSLAGVMGGQESEVTDETRNVLLEGAAWNFINIRRTAKQHNLPSEASFRFSRGVHPAVAEQGVKRGLQLMAEWSGGAIAPGLVDEYPLKPKDPTITVTPDDARRLLGLDLSAKQIADLLGRLEFKCVIENGKVKAKTPPHRLDIGEGIVGLADVLEEVARSYGFDRIPITSIADALPPQIGNPVHEWEEHLRDLLAALGMQEVVTYRMTSIANEARLNAAAAESDFVRIANPIAPERSVLRRALLPGLLQVLEKNERAESLALFEIGPVFESHKDDAPIEPRRLGMILRGARNPSAWDVKDSPAFDFFDLKGRVGLVLAGLRCTDITYVAASDPHLHPGKSAAISGQGKLIGAFGELHPLVKANYDLDERSVVVAEFDLDAMRRLAPRYDIAPIPETPAIYEDIAIIVDDSVAAENVEALIKQTGGRTLSEVRLFDVYRDAKIGAGKKSLAYSLTYQSDQTMTDAEAAAIRTKIVKRLMQELGAVLRG